MKKLLTLLVAYLSAITISAVSYPDKNISLTLTVGISHQISPFSDLGIPYNYITKCYAPSSQDNISGSYDLSDNQSFSVVPHDFSYSPVYGAHYYYYNYTLTPLKTGYFTFKQIVYWERRGYMEWGKPTITYNITVVEVSDVILPNTVEVKLGSTYQFSPIVVPNNATTNYTWTSLNPAVASVSADGTVTAHTLGETVITCMAHNGVTCRSTVKVLPIPVEKMEIDKSDTNLIVGEKLQLTTTVYPANATNKSVTWSSTNEAVAVVDGNGLVTAVGSGTCQVKATAADGSGQTATCLVTVEKNNKLTLTDMAGCSGGRGTMRVVLTDEETVLGFQFDLQLPTGVTVATDDGTNLLATLLGNAATTHSIRASKLGEGLYRFIVTSMSGKPISSSGGDGMSISIDVADDVVVGTYSITIKNIEMTIKNGSDYEDVHPRDNSAVLTITEAMLGDVNGDGRISVTDVISIVGYIMENEPSKFIRKVADVNGDGSISITDAVLVIDMILSGESTAKTKHEEITFVEPQ